MFIKRFYTYIVQRWSFRIFQLESTLFLHDFRSVLCLQIPLYVLEKFKEHIYQITRNNVIYFVIISTKSSTTMYIEIRADSMKSGFKVVILLKIKGFKVAIIYRPFKTDLELSNNWICICITSMHNLQLVCKRHGKYKLKFRYIKVLLQRITSVE